MNNNLKIKTYTKAEVLKHNKKDDCWVIIEGGVYDLSSFIEKHPGGSDIILSRAGEDATSFFTTKHGLNENVKKQLKRYKIGEVEEARQRENSLLDEAFTKELLSEIEEKGLYKIEPKTRLAFNAMRVLMVLLFFLSSLAALYLNLPVVVCTALIVFQAILGTSLFGFIAHESTHRNFPKSKALKILLEILWPVIWPFISKKPLFYEHNSHHVKIGDEDHDFEVAGFAQFIRYSASIKRNAWHKWQHRIALIYYPFYANIITTIGGIKSKFWERHNRSVALYHSLSILIALVYYIIIPSVLMGFSFKWFLYYLLYQCVLFTGIYLGAAINHFIPQTLDKGDSSRLSKYGYYICYHTSNFGVNNPFWFWFTGGFNIQIEHHLAPFVPVENLKELVPIVRSLCEKYNYPYIHYASFMDLWVAHYDYLEKLSWQNGEFEKANKANYVAK